MLYPPLISHTSVLVYPFILNLNTVHSLKEENQLHNFFLNLIYQFTLLKVLDLLCLHNFAYQKFADQLIMLLVLFLLIKF